MFTELYVNLGFRYFFKYCFKNRFVLFLIDGSSPVKINEVQLKPTPVVVKAGAEVTFGGRFTVAGAAGTNYELDVTLWKSGWWGTWIRVFCFGHW